MYFEPNEHWFGTVVLDITAATLVDNASGATKAAATLTDGSFEVTESSSGFTAHFESTASPLQHSLFSIIDTSEDLRFEQHVAGIAGHDGRSNGGHAAVYDDGSGNTPTGGTDHSVLPLGAGPAAGHIVAAAGVGQHTNDTLRLADLVDYERESLETMLKEGNFADPHQDPHRTAGVDLLAATGAPEQAHTDTDTPHGGSEPAPPAVHAEQVDTLHTQSAHGHDFTVSMPVGHEDLMAAQMALDVLRITG